MRVLIAHSFYRIAGGEDHHVRQQLELLRPHYNVRLLARENATLAEGLGTAARMTFSRRELRTVEEEIGQFKPDIVHLHNAYPALGPAVHLAAERLGIPLVTTVHNFRLRCPNGLMFTQGRQCRRCVRGNYANALLHNCFPTSSQAGAYATALWTHRFLARLEAKVALFIAPSKFIGDRLGEWGVPPTRIAIVQNFVTPPPDASAAPGSTGMYVGRLSSEKGLPALLEALLAAGDPPFQIVGEGPMQGLLVRLAAELGLKRTRFMGRLSRRQVREMLPAARYVAAPSLCDENAPLAVLEAMAAGRPVLLSRRGGLPELVSSGGGLVCEPGDVRGLAHRIRELMEDDELCVTLGAQALAGVQERHSPERHFASLESAYLRVRPVSRRAG